MRTLRCYEVSLQDKNNTTFTGIVVSAVSIFDWAKMNGFVVQEVFGFLPARIGQRTKLNSKSNSVSGFRCRVAETKLSVAANDRS
jgi:hypothetical protein